MSNSSVSNIKSGLIYIKNNFGALWLMTFKVGLMVIPLMLIGGASIISLIGLDNLFMTYPSAVYAGVAHMSGFMGLMSGMMENIYTTSIIYTVLAGIGFLLAPLPLMLAGSAMGVSVIRSIVLNQPLNTAIFSKLFDKTVLKYFGVIF